MKVGIIGGTFAKKFVSEGQEVQVAARYESKPSRWRRWLSRLRELVDTKLADEVLV